MPIHPAEEQEQAITIGKHDFCVVGKIQESFYVVYKNRKNEGPKLEPRETPHVATKLQETYDDDNNNNNRNSNIIVVLSLIHIQMCIRDSVS